MEPRFEFLSEKKLVGVHLRMSLVDNKTRELWASFMPRREEVMSRRGSDFFNLQVYESDHYLKFNPARAYDAWALVEVNAHDLIPEGMEKFIIPEGEYAVFIHKGANTAANTFQYIFSQWLPISDYLLDNRPHFEVLGVKYKNNDPNSEEEVWIPIKKK